LKEYYLSQGRPEPRKHVFGRQRDRRAGDGEKSGRVGKAPRMRGASVIT